MHRRFVQIETNRHGNRTIYFRRSRGQRVRLPDDFSSPAFRVAYAAALTDRPLPHVRSMPHADERDRIPRMRGYLVQALRAARTRARYKSLPFDLTLEALIQMSQEQEYRCALTGIEFFAPSSATARISPFVPSIDRIDPRKGYVCGNVRLLIFAMNAMLLDWGEPIFEQVANSYRYWKTKKAREIPLPYNSGPAP